MTEEQIQQLKPHLRRLLTGSIAEAELAKLVQFSRAIVQGYLQYVRYSVSRLCLNQGLTLTDLAYDCLGEVFARDEDRHFYQLQNFGDSLDVPLDDIPDRQLFFAYKAFLVRVAEVQLARTYAQADPAGAKLHRNLRDALNNSSCFTVTKSVRGLVLTPAGADALSHRDAFPPDQLERQFALHHIGRQTIPELLHRLHRILTDQSEYRRAIPLMDVVVMVKSVYAAELERMTSDDHHDGVNEFSSADFDQLCGDVELALKEKILFTYLSKRKLNRTQAEAIFNAFHDMMIDWHSPERDSRSLFEYLQRHLPINEETYECDFRKKMEYLLKVVRDEFAARLMREL